MALSEELRTMHRIAKLLEEITAQDPAAARRVEDWLRAKLAEPTQAEFAAVPKAARP